MKIHEVFFISLITSLLAGAVLFVAVPCAFDYASTTDHSKPFIGSEDSFFIAAFYGTYAFIQFWLSVINLVQINRRLRGNAMPLKADVIRDFLKGEAALYLFVYACIAIFICCFLGRESIGALPFIFIFSIPYAICCTASIFIFRHFIFKLYKPEPDEEQSDI